MGEKKIGHISDFFAKINVAAVKLTGALRIGDSIRIKGMTTDFTQTVGSMQIQNEVVEKAKAGDEIGIKVDERVRRKDKIFLIG